MKSSTENSRREVEKCSVHRSGSSAHEDPHKGLVVSKKADLAHEVFTRSKVVCKKGANHACVADGSMYWVKTGQVP